jgi:hydroxyethylthiazole kinase-like uncharacterized protein yjeF
MTVILTAAEMRALEREAIARGEVTGLELMERAGRGVVEAILAEWPEIESGARRAVVLCGPGNNGGDGFVVARLMKERGWEVEAFLYGEADRLPPDAKVNHDRWIALAKVESILATLDGPLLTRLLSADLVIDALLGLGLARAAPRLPALDLLMHRAFVDGPWSGGAEHPPMIVAVDLPSGLDADSGRELDAPGAGPPFAESRAAHLTVTFHAPKPGHLLQDGPRLCTRLRVADIGLPRPAPDNAPLSLGAGPRLQAVGSPRTDFLVWHRLGRANGGHKYDHGHAAIVSGGAGRGGAARLSARGALRIGAGLVTLAVPPAALQENAARLDATMLRTIKDAEALTDLLADTRLNSLCAGPGLGTGEREAALLSALLDASRPCARPTGEGGAGKGRAVVLDADALTLLSRDPVLRARLHAACVLTPHEGEFARLFPAIDARWRAPAITGPAFSKVDAAREAAREAGCVVLLKGPDTVIADPSGRAAINAAVYDRAAPWLATAGSGDVLAGFITGLLARGFAPFDAACTAAWLHVECARSFGPGLIAEDLPEEIPKVFRGLGL